jgi:hypothetical protein
VDSIRLLALLRVYADFYNSGGPLAVCLPRLNGLGTICNAAALQALDEL